MAEVALELQVCGIGLIEKCMVPADAVVLKEQEDTVGVREAISLHRTAKESTARHDQTKVRRQYAVQVYKSPCQATHVHAHPTKSTAATARC